MLAAVDHAHAGQGNAFAAVRPPGHHALASRAMGFCLVANAVVAARHAQRAGRHRVLIVDWDVHHGNGTQALIEHDETIRYVSLHQHPWYPGTGMADERGVGNVFNVPARARAPRPRATSTTSGRRSSAATTGWAPDLVLVSAGFDAMLGDPLGGFTLEPEHYADLTRRLRERLPAAPIVGLLEGGYVPARLADGVLAHCARPRPSLHRRGRSHSAPHRRGSVAQPLHMEAEYLELRTKHPFIIARGGQSDYRTIWVRLRDADGNEGWGEAAPSRFYGETAETVLAALNVYAGGHARAIRSTSRRPSAAGSRCCASTPSARAALSARCTIWSASGWASRSTGSGGSIPRRRRARRSRSASTRPSGSALKVREAAEYPILKIKLGTDRDVEILRTIRERRPTRSSGSTPTAAGP